MLPLVPAYTLSNYTSELSFVGVAYIALQSPAEIDQIVTLAKTMNFYIDTTSEFSYDDLIRILNSGVLKVFVSPEQYTELSTTVSGDRLVVKGDSDTGSCFVTYDKSLEGREGIYVNEIVPNSTTIPIIYGATKEQIADALLSKLTTDRPDGLYATLVVNRQNQSLGLVYSSQESIREAIRTGTGVYQSRKHGLWYKGATSGNTQKLVEVSADCDSDCLKFVVEQAGEGFCHLGTASCFGTVGGLTEMESTLKQRLESAPQGSYTKRLFEDANLLNAKIKEEADELCEASEKADVAWECADLLYFALVKCVQSGVSLADVERNLDFKSLKVVRRKGDAKPAYITEKEAPAAPATLAVEENTENELIHLNVIDTKESSLEIVAQSMQRPVQKTSQIMKLVQPIISGIQERGDTALLEFTEKFDGVKLETPVLSAPYDPALYQLPKDIQDAIDVSIENVEKFHAAQLTEPISVETQPGVICSRFSRPIEKVGLYIPGGTAVLPSTSLMLGVPAKVAGVKEIVFASPPRKDGSISPEVVYVAHKVGAKCIVLAGGAQAVAAMAYGTETVPKVDKIMGPGNQFVTAAKMYISNDTQALCSIDMPAGPSEVLVICDADADFDFVASDLLSQAEHGVDSQVILIGVGLSGDNVRAIQNAVHEQALKLPRVDIVRKCIKHSTILLVDTMENAFKLSNQYAPEHLILQIENASKYIDLVDNAGSIFVGAYSPESCGDYSSGTNHTLPTYGYARQYSGVNTATFQKFITSQDVNPEGLTNIGHAVMSLAKVEGLDAHRNAVKIRMEKLGLLPDGFQ